MVRNKTELLQKSNAWMGVALKDLRKHLVSFINLVKTANGGIDIPIDTVARMFGEDPNLIRAIYNGQVRDIPLSFFAKLLIATNHAIEIKQIEHTPFAQMDAPRRPAPAYARPMGMPNRQPQREERRRVYTNIEPIPHQSPVNQRMAPRAPRPTMYFDDYSSTMRPAAPVERTYNPETNTFDDAAPRAPFGGEMPPMPPMPDMGYPMPNPDGMLPPPEVMMEQARTQAMRDRAAEVAQMNTPNDELLNENVPAEGLTETFDEEETFIPDYDDGYVPAEDHDDDPMDDFDDDDVEDFLPEDEETGNDVGNPQAEDDCDELARALRNNPEIANLLRRML